MIIGAALLVGGFGAVQLESLGVGPQLLLALLALVVFAIFWGYYIFFEAAWNGQTPGKRLLGLRVMRADGTPVALTEVAIRNLVRIVDFLPLAYGVGVLTMFFQPQSRRMGDLAAGTLVVFDRTGVTLPPQGQLREVRPVGLAIMSEAAALPIARLAPAELQVIDSFLERRRTLINSDALARDICVRMYARLDGQLPGGLSGSALVERLQAVVYLARHPEQQEALQRAAGPWDGCIPGDRPSEDPVAAGHRRLPGADGHR